jgi:uncharacterized membrane protein
MEEKEFTSYELVGGLIGAAISVLGLIGVVQEGGQVKVITLLIPPLIGIGIGAALRKGKG